MNDQEVTNSVEQLMASLMRLRRTAQILAEEALAVETALRRVVVEITGRLSRLGTTIEGLEAVVTENGSRKSIRSGSPAAASTPAPTDVSGSPPPRAPGARRGR